ncbi:MAG TPA: hypothetical protein VHT97_06630 [Acidimicrobiales bacterium]|jgi:hypothetical protein|nr:hypothetical protein [Acidimicrobiales bacterium]
MTDTLQMAPSVPAREIEDADDDLGCGCCTRPPSAAAEKVAQLAARREAVERRLRSLSPEA